GPEEDLLRRLLAADIDRDAAPQAVGDVSPERSEDSTDGERRKILEPVPPPPRREAAAGHPQERRDQHDIAEKLQEDNKRAKPANAGQLEKQDEEPDKKQIERLGPDDRSIGGDGRRCGDVCHMVGLFSGVPRADRAIGRPPRLEQSLLTIYCR